MGVVLLKALRIPDGFRGPAVAASAFGNSLALPVVLISAIVGSGKVGHLTFTPEDEGAALLYLGAYMTTLTILMWSVGPTMMKAESDYSAAAAA
jgi:predicted permease